MLFRSQIAVVIPPHRVAAAHAEGLIGGQRADVGASRHLEGKGLFAVLGFAGAGAAALVQAQPTHRNEVGEAAAQAVEGGGIGTHRNKLLGAQAQEIALGGIAGIVKGAAGGGQPQSYQLIAGSTIIG